MARDQQDGYIMIDRGIVESEIWNKPPLYIKVWLLLIIKAQHAGYKGLRRGQLRVTIDSKALQASEPQIFAKYAKQGKPYRVFNIQKAAK